MTVIKYGSWSTIDLIAGVVEKRREDYEREAEEISEEVDGELFHWS